MNIKVKEQNKNSTDSVTKRQMTTTGPFSKGGHCVGHHICKFQPCGYISLDLQGAVEKIESGLKGETNEWKSRAVDLIWPSVKARTRHARFTCKRRTSAFFPLRKLSSRVAQRRRYPPCLSKILSLFADVPSLGLLS